ncbi:uncharacterized protein LOC134435158 [Engraulis encrasicolus]|uniref:uncharacterized protein LOC134435158 n=1 Tax=Engraulis encrasicolus TaxID=184585 RepID=UPI002FD2873E
MYQKGTKRKFADTADGCGGGGEEEEEEEAAAALGLGLGCAAGVELGVGVTSLGVSVGVGVGVGGLGGLTGEDAVSLRMLSSYSLQRQTMLNMSLVKLQLCHMLVEPNLCRSVLIANTVRHIQEEMTYDLTWQVGAAVDAMSQAHSQLEQEAQQQLEQEAQESLSATSDLLCRSALTGEEPDQQPSTPFNALVYSGEDDADADVEDKEEEEEDVVVDEEGDAALALSSSSSSLGVAVSSTGEGPFLSGRLALGGAGVGGGGPLGLGPRWQGDPPEGMDLGDDEDEEDGANATVFGKGVDVSVDDDNEGSESDGAYERTAAGAAATTRTTMTMSLRRRTAGGQVAVGVRGHKAGASSSSSAGPPEHMLGPLFEANRPTPVPEAALEELFSDVEASYLDLDSVLTGMQGGGAATGTVGGVGGVVGVGGATLELLEGLSSTPIPTAIAIVTPTPTTTTTAPPEQQTHAPLLPQSVALAAPAATQTPLSASAGCRPDQTALNAAAGCRPDLSELDHIMEIIVGS